MGLSRYTAGRTSSSSSLVRPARRFFSKQNHIKDAGTGEIYVPGGHALVIGEQQIIPSTLLQKPISTPAADFDSAKPSTAAFFTALGGKKV